MYHRQASSGHHARNTSVPVASKTASASGVHARNPSLPTRTHYAHPVVIPTPPYLPMPAAKKATIDNSNQPSLLAKLAAAATLTLLPNHRPYTSAIQLAHKIQRYLNLVRLPPVITHLALLYLYRVADSAFPVECYSIEQLFVTAYALADTHLDDNAYSNKSWLQVLNDGTRMREWHQGEMLFLEQGLNYRLEVTDEEWKRWCNWLCEWWGRVGQVEWKRVEMGKSAVFCAGAPTFARTVPVVQPPQPNYAAPIVYVHGHSMESMVGYGVDDRKRMSQMAEYDWSPEVDDQTRLSPESCYQDMEEDDEVYEEEEDDNDMEEEEPQSSRPSLRKSDSGYCGQYTPVPPQLHVVNDTKECDSDDSLDSYTDKKQQHEQQQAETKRASLRWKWTMF